MNGRGWTTPELAAIQKPLYARADYKALPALRHRTKNAIARKRNALHKEDQKNETENK